jgi:hypothetical protein
MHCVLLDVDVELRSKSFTFGRTRVNSVLLSLNHDFFVADDVNACWQPLCGS